MDQSLWAVSLLHGKFMCFFFRYQIYRITIQASVMTCTCWRWSWFEVSTRYRKKQHRFWSFCLASMKLVVCTQSYRNLRKSKIHDSFRFDLAIACCWQRTKKWIVDANANPIYFLDSVGSCSFCIRWLVPRSNNRFSCMSKMAEKSFCRQTLRRVR